jgi:hypothetical protein
MSFLPNITFYTTDDLPYFSISKGHVVDGEEASIIKRFVDDGYTPFINGIKQPKKEEIIATHGFFWCIGDERLTLNKYYKGQPLFMHVYYNSPKRKLSYPFYTFGKLLGLQTKRRNIDTDEAEPSSTVEPSKCVFKSNTVGKELLPDGGSITRITGGDRAAEVDKLIAELNSLSM